MWAPLEGFMGRADYEAVVADMHLAGGLPWALPVCLAVEAAPSGERVALNFLQRLSGVATMTRRFVDAVQGTGARILDTRKTTPGWRALEKAAVRTGGGENHRAGLYDMVLIKENHAAIAGGIAEAVARVRDQNTRDLPVTVEVHSLDDLDAALSAVESCDSANFTRHSPSYVVLTASCHCGKTGWTLQGDPGSITACNCTLCRRYGWLLAYDYEGERVAISGDQANSTPASHDAATLPVTWRASRNVA